MHSKAAETTPTFWVITILVAAAGETTSDLLARAAGPTLALAGGALLLAGVTTAQVLTRRHHHWLYWTTVAVAAVVGTAVADALHVVLGAGYAVTGVALVCVLAVVVAVWYLAEATIDVRTVTTRSREVFHWAAVVGTFALGTAVADLAAGSLGLGHPVSAVVFALLAAAPAVAHRWLAMPAVPAFWCGYVLVRPLGVTLADAVAVDRGVGPAPVAAATLAVAAALVWRSRPRVAAPAPPVPARQADEVWIG